MSRQAIYEILWLFLPPSTTSLTDQLSEGCDSFKTLMWRVKSWNNSLLEKRKKCKTFFCYEEYYDFSLVIQVLFWIYVQKFAICKQMFQILGIATE